MLKNMQEILEDDTMDAYRKNVEARLDSLTVMNAQQNKDIHYIIKSVDNIEQLLNKQNGRVRTNENKISFIFGIGSIGTIVALLITWLY